MGAPEEVTRYRVPSGAWRVIKFTLAIAAIGLAVVEIFGIVVMGRVLYSTAYFGLLSALLLPLVFLFFPATGKSAGSRIPWYDIALAVGSIAGPLLVFILADDIERKGWSILAPPWAFYAGLLTWLVVLEGVRRTTSLSMVIVLAVFSLYPLVASRLPGIFTAGEYSLERLTIFYYLTDSGMWGLMPVYARTIIGYLIFAAALQYFGGGRFFINVALWLTGRFRGGPAKVSIVSSAFLATMAGSPVANVLGTGPFTIPTMKRAGYPPHYAAAVESCASTGGVLTPPVMGAVAFLMANFLNITYAQVCLAAIIPAFLFYVSLWLQTDFYAAKTGLTAMKPEEIPSMRRSLAESGHFLFVVAVLVFFIWRGLTSQAPFFATAALIVLSLLRRATRPGKQAWMEFIDGSGNIMAYLLVVFIGIGLILGSLTITGLAHGMASLLTDLAGNSIFLLLVMGALASFVMGMGMTVSACYIFLAIVLVPALVSNGVYPVAAHLFVIYWGMISFITPPVALAVFAAAALAGSETWKTGLQAVRLGFVGFVVPFLFVYNTALVGNGSWLQVVGSTVVAMTSIMLLCAAAEGYFFFAGRIGVPTRAIMALVAVVMAIPGIGAAWTAAGLSVVTGWVLWVRLRQKGTPGADRAYLKAGDGK